MFVQIRNRLRVFVAQHRSRQRSHPRFGRAYGSEIFPLSPSVLTGNVKWVLPKFDQMAQQVQPVHVKVNKFEVQLSSGGWGLACPPRYHLPRNIEPHVPNRPQWSRRLGEIFEITVFPSRYNSAERANRNDRCRIPPSSPECRNSTYELTMALKWSWIRLNKGCRNSVLNKLNNTIHQAIHRRIHARTG